MKKDQYSENRTTTEAVRSLEKTVVCLCQAVDAGFTAAFRDTASEPAYIRQLQKITNLLENWGDPGKLHSTGNSSQNRQPSLVPNLVKGSVLPANRTFQTALHYEKQPESDSLSRVMEEYSLGNIAGQEATLAVLRQILAAVSDISIGDEVITGAVLRRQEKLAVVKGGQW